MTTCRRLDLFRITIQSIHDRFDTGCIDHGFIVDDNSSDEDVEEMEQLCLKLPFPVHIVKKPEAQRGHAKSMNLILAHAQLVKADFIFHCEDDFNFFWKIPYIQRALEILNHDPQLGQCLFNNGYKEEMSEMMESPWGLAKDTADGIRYRQHIQRHGVNPCSYWHSFSLRPGVYRVSSLLKVGEFVEVGSFEIDYALRYHNQGFRTAYFEFVSSEHIGRKTKDRFGNQPNAYVLNGSTQFQEIPLRNVLINLERRPDRRKELVERGMPLEPEWVQAVDGQQLTPCTELNSLFRENQRDMTAGQVGCALTHLRLWTMLADGFKQAPAMLVLEDDIRFTATFTARLERLLSLISGPRYWDMVFLGYHTRGPAITKDDGITHIESFTESLSLTSGGTFGYLIRHTAVPKLFKFLKKRRMTNAIDTVIQRAIDEGLVVLYLNTPIIYSTDSPSSIEHPAEGGASVSLYDSQYPDDASWETIERYVRGFQMGLL